MKKINVIFATTDANRLLRPLVNRCEEIYFNLYKHSDLIRILKLYLGQCTIDVPNATEMDIGYACRGRARTAFLLAQNIRRQCKIDSTKILTNDAWMNLAGVFGIHPLGLNSKEVKLMSVLNKHGVLSCANLAIKLGVTEDNIKDEWEMRPKELGLVESTSKGRGLTESGKEYLGNLI
jgi:Holliday junction resolvasome RuvABC ATP-dependent DNA helicase subunit